MPPASALVTFIFVCKNKFIFILHLLLIQILGIDQGIILCSKIEDSDQNKLKLMLTFKDDKGMLNVTNSVGNLRKIIAT